MALSPTIVRVSIGGGRGDRCILGEGTGVLKALTEGRADDATAVPALYNRRVLFAATPLQVLCLAPLRQSARHGPERTCLGRG